MGLPNSHSRLSLTGMGTSSNHPGLDAWPLLRSASRVTHHMENSDYPQQPLHRPCRLHQSLQADVDRKINDNLLASAAHAGKKLCLP
jgi:hypothetical protein